MKQLLRLLPLALLVVFSCGQTNHKDAVPDPSALTANAGNPPNDYGNYLPLIKAFVDSAFPNNSLNGSILVAKDGQPIYEYYNGYADPKRRLDSIHAETPFHLASISKTFTGMAVLKLWEQGRLQIDSLVAAYLPGFPCQGVTVRMLLNHRSGIPKYDHYMEQLGWDKRKQVTNQGVLDFLIARRKDIPVGRPNRSFSYSNTNYALLALIVEKQSGLFYGDFLKQTFFDSIGMKDTYVFTKADSARALPSYYNTGRAYPFDYLDLVYGDKNIYSTVRDLLKWDQALRSGRFFKQETLNAAYSPYSFEKPGIHNYGLGWRMYVLKNNKRLIYHNGWWHGNRTAFYRLIDEDATIIALCNNDSKRIYSVRGMVDIFGDYEQGGDAGEGGETTAVQPRPTVRKKKPVATKGKPALAQRKKAGPAVKKTGNTRK
ncbi:MAG: serine hydrolase [Candidatus Pseudobacter hemicellulosilyticus]|uniref:Serine hydrolase n=1 Tax=Candidatus Pseudobacter hemicellulosilyticus TaxID=3121375 RepID=A0AAJ5WPZ0_9BACT|nr:MAG: serine hydrolase [Pseudobacter sp.]